MTIQINTGQPEITDISNILDISVPTQLENPISTGLPSADLLFSGSGIIPSTSAILTGLPGYGKTTYMLQLADAITQQGHIAIYNSGEESLFQIRKTTKRLNLENGFIPSYELSAQDIIAKTKRIQELNQEKQTFLFVDSLQCVEFDEEENKRGRKLGELSIGVKAMEMFTSWAKETFGIVIVIGQITKNGQLAGKNALKHIVDCYLHLEECDEKGSELYGLKIATMKKSRFGIANVSYQYEILSSGLVFNFTDVFV